VTRAGHRHSRWFASIRDGVSLDLDVPQPRLDCEWSSL